MNITIGIGKKRVPLHCLWNEQGKAEILKHLRSLLFAQDLKMKKQFYGVYSTCEDCREPEDSEYDN